MEARILLLSLSGMVLMCPMPFVPAVFAQDPVGDQNIGAPHFFSALRDIPLMDGLVEAEGSTISFDKAEGRIIEVYAILEHSRHPDDVLTYYTGILPQFGWGQTGRGQFYRSGELLTLSFLLEGDRNIIKFSVTPTR